MTLTAHVGYSEIIRQSEIIDVNCDSSLPAGTNIINKFDYFRRRTKHCIAIFSKRIYDNKGRKNR